MLECSFVDHGRCLLMEGTGHVRGKELIRAKKELLEREAEVRRISHCIVALEGASRVEISREEIRAIVELDVKLAAWVPHLAIAVVAPQDLSFGLARMWQVYVAPTGWRNRVFRKRSEAEAWLKNPVAEGGP